MKLKKILSLVMAGALATSLVACGEKKEQKSEELTSLRVGVMGSIDVVPIAIAKENGYFEDLGIDLDLQIFTAAKDRDAALQAGELDGVLCDDVAISIYQNSGIDMKITGTTTGYWSLVAGKDSGIENISDIEGKSIAISERTMIEYLAYYLANENNINPNNVGKIAIPAMPARLEALKNNQVSAAILPAPFNDTAIADGGKEITTIYNDDINISVTAFLQSVIDEKADTIKNFYKAYDMAVEELNKEGVNKYEDIVIKTVGYSEDMRGKIVLPEFKKNALPEAEKVQKVFDWSKENGIIDAELNANDIINDVAI